MKNIKYQYNMLWIVWPCYRNHLLRICLKNNYIFKWPKLIKVDYLFLFSTLCLSHFLSHVYYIIMCIDNFRFCLSINKNGRIIRFQWMNQATKRKAPSGRAVLTRTTRKDKHRKYRPISEMRNALKLNQ